MAKRPQKAPTAPDGKPLDAPDYNPFLKADKFPSGKGRVTLDGWFREVDGQYGPQIVVECSIDGDDSGTMYDWAIKRGSPMHREMHMRFGPDFARWRGPVDLIVKHGQFGAYLSVEKVPF